MTISIVGGQKGQIVADAYSLDLKPIFHVCVPVEQGENLPMRIMHAIGATCHGRRILGVTIGLPGVIDPKTNKLLSSTVLAVEDAENIYDILKDALPDANLYLKNNSGLIAYAEKEFGAHSAVNNLVSIDINDGVGARIIIDDAIYGGGGMAGEFGHISVNYRRKRCKCGNYGCLEAIASLPAILEKTECKSVDSLREALDNLEEKLSYIHRRVGFNYRMTEIQSIFGINELKRLDSWNLTRRFKHAKMYDEAFTGLKGIKKLPVNTEERKCAYWWYPMLVDLDVLDCDAPTIVKELGASGIPCYGIQWPEAHVK